MATLETPSQAAALEQERSRLAAVVFTDVVSYSSRMQRDEEGTIAAVHADFARMREICVEHAGEILNTMGDGMMLCFGSAVDAVNFALKMQGEFGKRNETLPPGKGLMHRVGIHIGDVRRVEGGHIAGDGVNIAARLESKAPHGGICISQIVYDTVKRKITNMRAETMGPQTFKNIAEPIVVWRLVPEGGAVVPPTPVVRVRADETPSKGWLGKIVWLLVLMIAAETAWEYKDMWMPKDVNLGPVQVVLTKMLAALSELKQLIASAMK